MTYQQDNAPIHHAMVVQNYFRNQNVNVMAWPPLSPDRECVAYDKEATCNTHYPKIDALWVGVEEAWNNINMEEVRTLVVGMQGRMREVIRKRGGYTRH